MYSACIFSDLLHDNHFSCIQAYASWVQGLSSNPDIMGGAICIPDTRLPVKSIFQRPDQIKALLEDWPYLSVSDIKYSKIFGSQMGWDVRAYTDGPHTLSVENGFFIFTSRDWNTTKAAAIRISDIIAINRKAVDIASTTIYGTDLISSSGAVVTIGVSGDGGGTSEEFHLTIIEFWKNYIKT